MGKCPGHLIYGKSERDRPWVVPSEGRKIRWGKQALHQSHQAKLLRGIIYCTECGAWSSKGHTFRKLSTKCMSQPSSKYAQQTCRLSKGMLRPGLGAWLLQHNYPGQKGMLHPDSEWAPTRKPVDGAERPGVRGQTETGHKTSPKIRDLRLRKQLTGTVGRPARRPPYPQPASKE